MSVATFENFLDIRIWKDPVVERVGYDASGDYVELFWLPIIGPTSTWLLRRLATSAVLRPDGCTIDTSALALSMGVGSDTGPRSSLSRSVQRLVIFGLARSTERTISVRTVVPPLTMKHLTRLPEHLQIAHSLWSEKDAADAYEAAYSGSTGSIDPESARTPVTSSVW